MEMFNPVPKPKHKRKAPKRGKRGQIDNKEYNKVIDNHGYKCWVCGSTAIEMHHVVFRSQGGRGVYRNLIPLCNEHHKQAHRNPAINDSYKNKLRDMYGPYFYYDEHDLWLDALIQEPTKEHLEKFFEGDRSGAMGY